VRASPRNNTYAWSVSYGECSKSCARGKCRRACVTASKRRQTWRYSKTLYKDSNFGSLAIVVLWNVSLAVGEIIFENIPVSSGGLKSFKSRCFGVHVNLVVIRGLAIVGCEKVPARFYFNCPQDDWASSDKHLSAMHVFCSHSPHGKPPCFAQALARTAYLGGKTCQAQIQQCECDAPTRTTGHVGYPRRPAF